MTQIREGGVEIPAGMKPCPFCGSAEVELRQSATDEMIACCECGSRTGVVYLGESDAFNAAKRRELIAVWNRRTPTPSPEIADPFTTARNEIAGLPGHGMSADVQVAEQPMDLWRDEIGKLVEAGFATVSRNPSDHEVVLAYRAAIHLALATPKPADPTSVAGERMLSILLNARGRMAQHGRKYVRLDLAEINGLIDALATNAPDAAKREGL